MDRIYRDSVDMGVAATIVYANDKNAIFFDKDAKNEPVDAKTAIELFQKGIIAVKGNTMYKAKTCSLDGVIDFGFPAATKTSK